MAVLFQNWFAGKSFKVLYGDTDFLFVETGLGGSGVTYAGFTEYGGRSRTKGGRWTSA